MASLFVKLFTLEFLQKKQKKMIGVEVSTLETDPDRDQDSFPPYFLKIYFRGGEEGAGGYLFLSSNTYFDSCSFRSGHLLPVLDLDATSTPPQDLPYSSNNYYF